MTKAVASQAQAAAVVAKVATEVKAKVRIAQKVGAKRPPHATSDKPHTAKSIRNILDNEGNAPVTVSKATIKRAFREEDPDEGVSDSDMEDMANSPAWIDSASGDVGEDNDFWVTFQDGTELMIPAKRIYPANWPKSEFD